MKLTIKDIRELEPCYDPSKYLTEDWQGTVQDILLMDDVPAKDRIWVAVHLVPRHIAECFAVDCAFAASSYAAYAYAACAYAAYAADAHGAYDASASAAAAADAADASASAAAAASYYAGGVYAVHAAAGERQERENQIAALLMLLEG